MGFLGKIFGKKDKKKGKDQPAGGAAAKKEKAAAPARKAAPEPEEAKPSKKSSTESGEFSAVAAGATEPSEQDSAAKVEVNLDSDTGGPAPAKSSATGRLSSGNMPAIPNSVTCAGCQKELPVPLVGHATTVICPFCTTPTEYNPQR